MEHAIRPAHHRLRLHDVLRDRGVRVRHGRRPAAAAARSWGRSWRSTSRLPSASGRRDGCDAGGGPGGLALAWSLAPPAHAQDPAQPVEEGAVEQSCRALQGGTRRRARPGPGRSPAPGIPPTLARGAGRAAARARRPAHARPRRSTAATSSRRATGGSTAATAARPARGASCRCRSASPAASPSISLDDDELIALDTARPRLHDGQRAQGRVAVQLDRALGDAVLDRARATRCPTASRRGRGRSISPLEDETWTDPAGNRTAIGAGKVSHIWGLRAGGRRLTFWDPWLPLDESYEMCGPHRGRFTRGEPVGERLVRLRRRARTATSSRASTTSTSPATTPSSSSTPTRTSAARATARRSSSRPSRGREQPKIPGAITSAISIHKVGPGSIHRILRVEGSRDGRDRLLGARRRRPGRGGLDVPRDRRCRSTRPRARQPARATPRRAASGRARTTRFADGRPAELRRLQRLLLARAPARARRAAACASCACTTSTGCASRRAAAASTTCRATQYGAIEDRRASSRRSPSRRRATRSCRGARLDAEA